METPTFLNPVGTNGFAFLEFAAPDPAELHHWFKALGFAHVGQHKTLHVEWWQQNDCHFLINAEPNSAAAEFAAKHGPSTCGMGFCVKDARQAFDHCCALEANPFAATANDWSHVEAVPAISGIGNSALYFVNNVACLNDVFARFPDADATMAQCQKGLHMLDHVTHNVQRGQMDVWADFYQRLFGFREIRYFDIEGQQTGLRSRAMTGACGKLRIPLNESSDDKSQIEEFLQQFNGEGIQHIALTTDNIYKTVQSLRDAGVPFLKTPATYYRGIDARLPDHGEPLEKMQDLNILVDGEGGINGKRLLQIFTETALGPVFFEIIERKGDEGFGEGNFKALFESIELDQMERGVL